MENKLKRKKKKKVKKVILIAFGRTQEEARHRMARAKNTPKL